MRIVSPLPTRTPAAALAAVLTLLCSALPGCIGEDDLSGLWEMPVDGPEVSIPVLGEGFTGRVRMAVGQYGKDIAGEVVFYEDSYHKTSLFAPCSCAYLDDSEVRDGRLTFSIATSCGVDILGDFNADLGGDRETLTGTLSTVGDNGQEFSLVLERVGSEDSVKNEELDRGCP